MDVEEDILMLILAWIG